MTPRTALERGTQELGLELPQNAREQMDLAVDRGLRYLDTGIPDLLWCEFPTSEREAVETFTEQIKKRFPDARFAFNWSSSFKWFKDPKPLTFAELGEMGVKFIFITLGAQHAEGYGLSELLQAMSKEQQDGYIALQRKEFEQGQDIPTKSHHFFSGVPYHSLTPVAPKASSWRLALPTTRTSPAASAILVPARHAASFAAGAAPWTTASLPAVVGRPAMSMRSFTASLRPVPVVSSRVMKVAMSAST